MFGLAVGVEQSIITAPICFFCFNHHHRQLPTVFSKDGDMTTLVADSTCKARPPYPADLGPNSQS